MDYYIRQYYSGNKVPKGILTVNTSNADSFAKWWDTFTENTRLNPHALNPLLHQAPQGANKPIEWVNFMNNLQEMQYTEVRNELRQQIGAIYGVSPLFQNDTSTGGGLNNEGLQITVTNRSVESGQNLHNEKTLIWMFEQLGISDYNIVLFPSEEKDEQKEKQLRLLELQIAKATSDLGIETRMTEEGEFKYKEGIVKVQQQNEFNPFGSEQSMDNAPEQTEATNEVQDDSAVIADKSDTPKVEKAVPNKVDPKVEKEVEAALINELNKMLEKIDFRRKVTEDELNKKVDSITREFKGSIMAKSSNKLKAIYQKIARDVSKQLNQQFSMTEKDKNIIEALKRQPVYQKAFDNITNKMSVRLKETIVKAYDNPEKFTIKNIVDEMRKDVEESEVHLQTIARTETSKIAVAARKTSYDKTGARYVYSHIGPNDDRTTQMSKKVVEMTKGGVDWDTYVNIIKRVSNEYNPGWEVNPEAPITHPNTRHIFIARRI
jgi:hypothetical protein